MEGRPVSYREDVMMGWQSIEVVDGVRTRMTRRPVDSPTLDEISHMAGMYPTLRLELQETQYQLAETRAVLADICEDRGESWLAQLAGRREELCALMKLIVSHTRTPIGGPASKTAELLRIVGGPEETQRQVDAAHEAALRSGEHLEDMQRTLIDPLSEQWRRLQLGEWPAHFRDANGDEIRVPGLMFIDRGEQLVTGADGTTYRAYVTRFEFEDRFAESQVDERIVRMAPNPAAFRAAEDAAFLRTILDDLLNGPQAGGLEK